MIWSWCLDYLGHVEPIEKQRSSSVGDDNGGVRRWREVDKKARLGFTSAKVSSDSGPLIRHLLQCTLGPLLPAWASSLASPPIVWARVGGRSLATLACGRGGSGTWREELRRGTFAAPRPAGPTPEGNLRPISPISPCGDVRGARARTQGGHATQRQDADPPHGSA